MGETKEVEGLGASLSMPLPALVRVASELDQASLFPMKFDTKFSEACLKFLQTCLRLLLALKTNDKIIRVTHDYHIAFTLVLSPPVDP